MLEQTDFTCTPSLAGFRVQSLTALHLYAQYNELAVNNAEKAESIISDADRIEEQAQKTQMAEGASAPGPAMPVFTSCAQQIVPADACGTIVISSNPQTLGQISFASMVACEIFGYTRSQLERHDVNIIIPEPIAEAQ